MNQVEVKKISLRNRILIGVFVVIELIIIGFIVCYFSVGSYSQYMISADEAKQKDMAVGIVFGSGVAPNGKPYDELRGRLDGAAELYQAGAITKIIVSGDNRFVEYNEPQSMQDYLSDEKQIPLDAIQQDNAGRSTYETCERANKIFSLSQAILITADSHLPRALFTCRKLGVESYGVAYGANANNAFRREFLARTKAMYNVYIRGEPTVLGDPINL